MKSGADLLDRRTTQPFQALRGWDFHQEQRHDDRQEGDGIDREAPGWSERGIGQSANRRADCRSSIEHGCIQGDGIGQVLAVFDQVGGECQPGWSVKGIGNPQQKGHDHDLPGLDQTGECQERHNDCQQRHGAPG